MQAFEDARLVANYLNLPDAEKFTGDTFRRISATIMANGGMSVDELKRHVAAAYVPRRIVGPVNESNTTATSTRGQTTIKPRPGRVNIIVATTSDNIREIMRSLLIISALVAMAFGRPEPPSGYQYQQPSSRYGAPSGNGGSSQGGFRSSSGLSNAGGGHGAASNGAGFGGGSSGGFGGAHASSSASASANSFSGGQSGHDTSSNEILVHKHVYVHVAPPDEEAPTPPTPTIPDIPPLQQDEEKTLVYVLVKKPEEQPEIKIPTAAPTEPSKPEVYFIRYKTQTEQHGGSQQGGAGQDFSQQLDDDTVEVGARQGPGASQGSNAQSASGASFAGASRGGSSFGGNSQKGASFGGASQGGAPQGGAFLGGASSSQSGASSSAQAFGGSGASSRSSNGISSQLYVDLWFLRKPLLNRSRATTIHPPPSSRYGPPSGRQGHFGGQPSDDGDFGNSAFGASGSGAPGPNSHFGGSGLNSGSGVTMNLRPSKKHIYVHVPPPEHHEHKPRQHIHFPPPQKHYKIIFIKAPPPPTPTAPEIPPIPQDEEKTLVYVLVKKPEEQPDIKIPTPVPTQPSSPEVYFIRYRTEKEESHGHSGYPQGGGYPGRILPKQLFFWFKQEF
ncbi:hypothetical protein NQ317_000452 [Molorchus minor]|uniref:DUF243 domain-containing protein n=1 Tax=Molorchus minor TaxID=1323400 RepID=A0ABQ9JHK6_9CUCU|nr:hypothetical protein NQ317_000452 [Molorchus minor]